MPLGFNTYCLRLMGWDDATALQYAADHELDAMFLQDSKDPRAMDPTHWPEVKARAADLGLHLETGGGSVLPGTAGRVFFQGRDAANKYHAGQGAWLSVGSLPDRFQSRFAATRTN